MSCDQMFIAIVCMKRVAVARRLSEFEEDPYRDEALLWLEKSCEGGVTGTVLRGRIPPGAREARLGTEPAVPSNQPNRGWGGKQGNSGRKTGNGGRHGKPSARKGTPSAVPAQSQRRSGLEFYSLSRVRSDAHDSTRWKCHSKRRRHRARPGIDAGGVSRGCAAGLHRISARPASSCRPERV